MDVQQLRHLVGDGKIFSVDFVKRSDGRVRRMIARTGVLPTGPGQPAYDAESRGLLTVFDMQKRAYRSIPADSVLRVKAHGLETQTELAAGRKRG